jgi:hypothetical protein
MVHWDVPRPPTSAALLTELAAEHGADAATCLAGTGLRLDRLAEPIAEVSARQELRVIANMLDALGDSPGLGVEAGVRYRLTAYGIWGFALISSPTLRSAIDVGLRYIDLTFVLPHPAPQAGRAGAPGPGRPGCPTIAAALRPRA